MHKVFISYYHSNHQWYKNELLNWAGDLFIDGSVDTGDIDPNLSDQSIRTKIRDEYLRDSSITIILVGNGTSGRKHIDWEIGSSMMDSIKNKKSGIVVIYLPEISSQNKRSYLPEKLESNYNLTVDLNWSGLEKTDFNNALEEAYNKRRTNDYKITPFRKNNS